MDNEAQRVVAYGLSIMFILLGIGGCTLMSGKGVQYRSEGIALKYENGVGGK